MHGHACSILSKYLIHALAQRVQILPQLEMSTSLSSQAIPHTLLMAKTRIEVLLSLPLSNKEIVWEMTSISAPTERGRSGNPAMTLKLILLNPD